MRKLTLLITSLSLAACGSQLPKAPHHVQYGVHANVSPPGFYGVDNQTKERVFRAFDDRNMKGAQCLTAQDYKEWADWVRAVKQIAERRCK